MDSLSSPARVKSGHEPAKSGQLVPAAQSRQLATVDPHAQISSRLVIDKCIPTAQYTLYIFRRRGGKSDWELKQDKTLPQETAMISVKRRGGTFTLSYYPKEGGVQVVKELEMSRMGEAAAILIEAGFPHYGPCKSDEPVPVKPESEPRDVSVKNLTLEA